MNDLGKIVLYPEDLLGKNRFRALIWLYRLLRSGQIKSCARRWQVDRCLGQILKGLGKWKPDQKPLLKEKAGNCIEQSRQFAIGVISWHLIILIYHHPAQQLKEATAKLVYHGYFLHDTRFCCTRMPIDMIKRSGVCHDWYPPEGGCPVAKLDSNLQISYPP